MIDYKKIKKYPATKNGKQVRTGDSIPISSLTEKTDTINNSEFFAIDDTNLNQTLKLNLGNHSKQVGEANKVIDSDDIIVSEEIDNDLGKTRKLSINIDSETLENKFSNLPNCKNIVSIFNYDSTTYTSQPLFFPYRDTDFIGGIGNLGVAFGGLNLSGSNSGSEAKCRTVPIVRLINNTDKSLVVGTSIYTDTNLIFYNRVSSSFYNNNALSDYERINGRVVVLKGNRFYYSEGVFKPQTDYTTVLTNAGIVMSRINCIRFSSTNEILISVIDSLYETTTIYKFATSTQTVTTITTFTNKTVYIAGDGAFLEIDYKADPNKTLVFFKKGSFRKQIISDETGTGSLSTSKTFTKFRNAGTSIVNLGVVNNVGKYLIYYNFPYQDIQSESSDNSLYYLKVDFTNNSHTIEKLKYNRNYTGVSNAIAGGSSTGFRQSPLIKVPYSTTSGLAVCFASWYSGSSSVFNIAMIDFFNTKINF